MKFSIDPSGVPELDVTGLRLPYSRTAIRISISKLFELNILTEGVDMFAPDGDCRKIASPEKLTSPA